MKRILVADDDAATREAGSLILQQEFGCAVDTAADGSAALERLHRTVPDAALVSLSMPAMAGGALCRRASGIRYAVVCQLWSWP